MLAEPIPVLNPATNEVIDTIHCGTAEDVHKAVARARQAAKLWKKVPLHERVQRIRQLAALVRENSDHLAHCSVWKSANSYLKPKMRLAHVPCY
jgi:acyl-CoA reductase-like NAD-dependent aldehyde dehydrogenase